MAKSKLVSRKLLQKADELIARGLERAMKAPAQSAEELWSEFDAVREKMKAQVKSLENRASKKS